MDVSGSVVVTVEEESESVFGEYSRHGIDFSR
jgi:KaiC/GvpD/RAD55 family RecA-like ATPase